MSGRAAIMGWGTALPEHGLEQAAAAALALELEGEAADNRRLPALYRRSGVQRRHSVLVKAGAGGAPQMDLLRPPEPGDGRGPTTAARMAVYQQHGLPLAARAARAALADAGVAAGSITHLVTVSCSGFVAPGVDIGLVDELGMRRDVERTHVGFMGCHGGLNGLRVARAFAEADPAARVLVCAVELCSIHYQYGGDAGQVVANALFADGAAAAVVGTDSGEDHWRLAATGTMLMPDSLEEMGWRIGDHGFEMTLSTRVPELIGAHLRPWLEQWLGGAGLRPEDVASWAIHPGGPRILDGVERSLGLDGEALAVSRAVLAEYGNMSSPTVLFILERLLRAGAPLPCVALAFGPGLVVEGVLLR